MSVSDPPDRSLPGAVLFACTMNRVRSPMAAGLLVRRHGEKVFVDSCGVHQADGVDPFVISAMAESSIDLSAQIPKTFEGVGASGFDLIIGLTAEAHERALQLARTCALEVEFWDTPDPTEDGGSYSQRLDAYRRVRDALVRKITDRFG